jgi:hypothetical protein
VAVRLGKRRWTAFAATLAAALLTAAWLAPSSQATVLGLHFSSKHPGATAGMTLHIRYTKPGQPNAKPSPIRRFQLDAPAGTVFHTATVPACEASDAEVRVLGPGACPSPSRIGAGPITVITGFGKPFDPFVSPTTVFNDGSGWLEISQTPSTPSVTIAVTRLTVSGDRVSGPIAASPGGPPDFQTAVSTVDLSFPASTGYITTPPTCPATGRWVATGTFTFADGTTQVVHGDTPCAAADGPAPIRASVRPKRARVGEQVRIHVRLRSSDPHCIANATVRLAGHRAVHSNGAGRASIVHTFHGRGRRTLIASKSGCASGRATLTVVPHDEDPTDDDA